MIALNIVLMTAVLIGIVSLLAWAIVKQIVAASALAGGVIPPEVAPLTAEPRDAARAAYPPPRWPLARSGANPRRPATRATTA